MDGLTGAPEQHAEVRFLILRRNQGRRAFETSISLPEPVHGAEVIGMIRAEVNDPAIREGAVHAVEKGR